MRRRPRRPASVAGGSALRVAVVVALLGSGGGLLRWTSIPKCAVTAEPREATRLPRHAEEEDTAAATTLSTPPDVPPFQGDAVVVVERQQQSGDSKEHVGPEAPAAVLSSAVVGGTDGIQSHDPSSSSQQHPTPPRETTPDPPDRELQLVEMRVGGDETYHPMEGRWLPWRRQRQQQQRWQWFWLQRLWKPLWLLPGDVCRKLLPSSSSTTTSSHPATTTMLGPINALLPHRLVAGPRVGRTDGGGGETGNALADPASSSVIEPHPGMVLVVTGENPRESAHSEGSVAGDDDNAAEAPADLDPSAYELLEVVHGELGGHVVHVHDYAYTPVLSCSGGDERHGWQHGTEPDGATAAAAGLGEERLPSPDDHRPNDSKTNRINGNVQAGSAELGATSRAVVGFTGTADLEPAAAHPSDAWWQWWIPKGAADPLHNRHAGAHADDDPFATRYRVDQGAFAGGSHGQVWRGRRRCRNSRPGSGGNEYNDDDFTGPAHCRESLILKRLQVDRGYRILEAGLREVHVGRWLAQQRGPGLRFTRYIDHFFRNGGDGGGGGGKLELWIVFADAGPSLRSYLYTGIVVGDVVLYQPSALWTQMRISVSMRFPSRGSSPNDHADPHLALEPALPSEHRSRDTGRDRQHPSAAGRNLMKSLLRQILESVAFLNEGGVTHRDIKPSNVLCTTNATLEILLQNDELSYFQGSFGEESVPMHCVLGDFSSAWSATIQRSLYTRGPSRFEQTDEYAPPEAIFGQIYNQSESRIGPAFDSWSIGILALEMLLGSPNVFTVDQRTRAVLTHRLKKEGASDEATQRALYLAALSQFCIYNPRRDDPLNPTQLDDDPIHRFLTVKDSCTLHDFHRALRARDPLGLGFDDSADPLLHLIWQLLAWDPADRITAANALKHRYFSQTVQVVPESEGNRKALESQMLDPRMDFNLSDSVDRFECPKCGRSFQDWNSCVQHATSRGHGKFCRYDRSTLPTCLSSHAMLPAHPYSGYCDIQGRRRVIEDFHAIRLLPTQQFYGIFDGHTGNLASKYVARFLYDKLDERLSPILSSIALDVDWKERVTTSVDDAFEEIHLDFLKATALVPHAYMDQSGTTATAAIVNSLAVVVASLGDSRAILSTRDGSGTVKALQLTKDHVASDPIERELVESRGGSVVQANGVSRVEGLLVITRSIGDANISRFLSRAPQVVAFSIDEARELCGKSDEKVPCFLILASDGLWDTISNQVAIDMVSEVVAAACDANCTSWRDTSGLQQAAEALTLEAYVSGSRDNIGVVVVAIV